MSSPKAAPEKGMPAWNPPGQLSLADRASPNTSSSPVPFPAWGYEGPGQTQMLGARRHSHPGSSLGCGLGPCPPSLALLPGSSCAQSGPGSAPAPQWPCSPITLMSAPLPLGFIGSQPALPG